MPVFLGRFQDWTAFSSLWGHAERNGLTTVSAIDVEVAVQGDDAGVVVDLRHPHQAGIGKCHWHICILVHERGDGRHVLNQVKLWLEDPTSNQLQQSGVAAMHSPQQETRFRQHSITCEDRGTQLAKQVSRPQMVFVPTVDAGNQWARVHQRMLHHWPNPRRWALLWERSSGPSTQPIRSAESARHDSGDSTDSTTYRSAASRRMAERDVCRCLATCRNR